MYQFNGARDGATVKKILAAVGDDLARARAMVDAYLSDTDDWLKQNGPGRPLSLLASRARLTKYLAQTAKPARSVGLPAPLVDSVLISDAKKHWASDMVEHPDDWRRIHELCEDGTLSADAIKHTAAKSGAEFRREVFG